MNTRSDILFLGVDGGGSGCRATISGQDLTPVIAPVRGHPANVSTDFNAAITALTDVITAAGIRLGLSPETLRKTPSHLGLSGVLDAEMATCVAAALPLDNVTVSGDNITSVAGALTGGDGAVLAVGTGSFVACSHAGKTRYIGGWGFHAGDQASGAWLGYALLRDVLKYYDGLLTASDLIIKTFGGFHNHPQEILTFCQTSTPLDYAGFAPAIVKAAQGDDRHALHLMQDGASYLEAALIALEYGTKTTPSGPLCLLGGLGECYAPYLTEDRRAALASPHGNALNGALYLASKNNSNQKGMLL